MYASPFVFGQGMTIRLEEHITTQIYFRLKAPYNKTSSIYLNGKDSDKAKAKAVSRSARAGLQFVVGRIHRHLKSSITSHGRVGATAARLLFWNI